jgi:hypothetical protein
VSSHRNSDRPSKVNAKPSLYSSSSKYQQNPHALLQLQKSIGNQAVTQLLKSDSSDTKKNFTAQPVQKYDTIKSDPPTRKDSMIYGYKTVNGSAAAPALYVGQALSGRDGQRFREHVLDPKESDRPWNLNNNKTLDYTGNIETWPYVPAALQKMNATKFETTAAEQWWYENEGGTSLYNKQQPMKKDTFDAYKTITGNYDPEQIFIGKTWKPLDN